MYSFPAWLYFVNQRIKKAFGLATEPFSRLFSISSLSLRVNTPSMDTELTPPPSTLCPITFHPPPHLRGASQSTHSTEKHIAASKLHRKNKHDWHLMRNTSSDNRNNYFKNVFSPLFITYFL